MGGERSHHFVNPATQGKTHENSKNNPKKEKEIGYGWGPLRRFTNDEFENVAYILLRCIKVASICGLHGGLMVGALDSRSSALKTLGLIELIFFRNPSMYLVTSRAL